MTAALAPVAARVGQLIRLLDSDKDGEVVAAARALGRTLKSVGEDFHSLSASIERTFVVQRTCLDWIATVEWLLSHRAAYLNDRELWFVRDMQDRRGEPTERQTAWLLRLYERERGRADARWGTT
jgi:hypothetical protein